MKRTDTIAVVALLLAAASANGVEIPASALMRALQRRVCL